MIRFSSPLRKIFTSREQEGEVKSANQAKAMEVQSQSGDYCLPSNYGDFTGVCVGIENVHMLLHVRRLVSSVVQG